MRLCAHIRQRVCEDWEHTVLTKLFSLHHVEAGLSVKIIGANSCTNSYTHEVIFVNKINVSIWIENGKNFLTATAGLPFWYPIFLIKSLQLMWRSTKCNDWIIWHKLERLLIHWGRVTHICVSKLTIIGSDNGLSPGRRQAIIWTNDGMLLIRTLGTNFIEFLSKIRAFSLKKPYLKLSSGKWRPFCLGLSVLITTIETFHII